MAALSEPRLQMVPGSLVDLLNVHYNHLDPLMAEEATEWADLLDWDFEPSADLVRRFVSMRALSGVALQHSLNQVPAPYAGYAYYVADEGKGLIGGLFLSRSFRTAETENLLLSSILDALWKTPGIHRVEAQLMMLTSPLDRSVPYADCFQFYPRQFLQISLDGIAQMPERVVSAAISPWSENRHSDGARLIAESYVDHIDSQINDQYRTSTGAHRFLSNIVQYPGCGAFFQPASFIAYTPSNQPKAEIGARRFGYHNTKMNLAGICLTSLVAKGVGHITQVCVAPSHRGTGLGYELMRRSLLALAERGCHTVTLTVTTANAEAVALYRRMGFFCRREFAAYVWDKNESA
ncbi:MAG: GNAT family N-acetyltransferase [Acidobacteriota bacterium]